MADSVDNRTATGSGSTPEADTGYGPGMRPEIAPQPQSDRLGQPVVGRQELETILELARWAPSADNTQPWRFELAPQGKLVIHGYDTRDSCVYDLDGRISQLSLGALLETIRIAATAHGLDCVVAQRSGMPDSNPTFDLGFSHTAAPSDPLVEWIKKRSVQRRPFSTRALTAEHHRELEASVGAGHRVLWFASPRDRLAMASMLFLNGRLRLRLPEAFEVHRNVIEWGVRESVDKIPDRAIGLDALSLRLTRWAFASWARVSFLNRYLAGTLLPSLELDFVPGIACAAHFVIVASAAPQETRHYVDGGRALQRLWLTATRLGLVLQPEVSPLVFARYERERRPYTTDRACDALARRMIRRLTSLLGPDVVDRALFMGRIGTGKPSKARSTRLPLAALYSHGPSPMFDGDRGQRGE